jgi:hypothetical protein
MINLTIYSVKILRGPFAIHQTLREEPLFPQLPIKTHFSIKWIPCFV